MLRGSWNRWCAENELIEPVCDPGTKASYGCRPGIEGAHEKGGVEGRIGCYRRNRFVPVPEAASLTELNAMADQWDQDDEARRLRGRTRTVGDYFVDEQHLLEPLPTEPFETGRWFTPRVDRFSQISVRGNACSVPVRFIGRQPRVLLHANELIVHDDRAAVTRHERLGGLNDSRLALDHYLEALLRKPGAFPGSTALEQARSAGRSTPVHDKRWAAAKAPTATPPAPGPAPSPTASPTPRSWPGRPPPAEIRSRVLATAQTCLRRR